MHVPGHIEIWWEPLPSIVDCLAVLVLVHFPRFLSVPDVAGPYTADGLHSRGLNYRALLSLHSLSQNVSVFLSVTVSYYSYCPSVYHCVYPQGVSLLRLTQSVVVLNLPEYMYCHIDHCVDWDSEFPKFSFLAINSPGLIHSKKGLLDCMWQAGQWQPC